MIYQGGVNVTALEFFIYEHHSSFMSNMQILAILKLSCRWNYKLLYSHSQLSLQYWPFTNHYRSTCVMFCWFISFTYIWMVTCSIFSLSYSCLIRTKAHWQGLHLAQDQQMKVIGWEGWPEGREEEILSTWLTCPLVNCELGKFVTLIKNYSFPLGRGVCVCVCV